MRRFELAEGTSSKFWAITVADSELTVNYGRIGTAGQSKTKALASAAAAAAEADKLIKEKLAKGYRETGGTAADSPAASTDTASPATAPAKTSKAAKGSKAAPAATPVLAWPEGGFQWTADLQSRLPALRGVHLPGLDPMQTRGLATLEVSDSHYAQSALEQVVAPLLAAGRPVPGVLPGGEPRLWTAQDAKEWLTPARLAAGDAAYWEELLIQCMVFYHYSTQKLLQRYVNSCIASRGLPFLLERLVALLPALTGYVGPWNVADSLFGYTRHAIAAAPEADYQAALAVATAARGDDPALIPILCYLFPEQQQWADDWAGADQSPKARFWLNQSAMSPAVALHHFAADSQPLYHALPGVLLQIRLHGEAALPLLELLLSQTFREEDILEVLRLLRRFWSPRMPGIVVRQIDRREVRLASDPLVSDWPVAFLQEAINQAAGRPDSEVAQFALRLALRLPQAVDAALEACTPEVRDSFREALRPWTDVAEAPLDALPELLRLPPWQRPPAEPVPSLDLAPPPLAATVSWEGEQRTEWLHGGRADNRKAGFNGLVQAERDPGASAYTRTLLYLAIRKAAHERILAGEPVQADDIDPRRYYALETTLLRKLPAPAGLAIWNSLPHALWADTGFAEGAQAILAHHELAALPGLLLALAADPGASFPLAMPFDAPAIALPAVQALQKSRKSRAAATAWLTRHAATAAAALLPAALGRERTARNHGQAGLIWLAANGHEAEVRAAARSCGPAAEAALALLLATDPRLAVPAKLPKLPGFFIPALFRRPRLHDGRALPLAAVEAIGRMLTLSNATEAYPGLETVKACCTADSLAAFAWDVFEAWLAADSPNKESWAFTGLGHLGNDETARRLAPKIREWPGESAHARAVTGLDLLAAIGSDVALMHLNGIASKVKFKGLQDKAKEKIAAVAEARGFTPEELADRLVPDLGLDENGSVLLDFGPRRFHVGFDQALKPFVKDETGARLKDLPKPNKSDDAALAEAAVERYKALKKDAKAVASLQVIRLEMAMCNRRRWPAADFRLFFLEHPLSRHLARRLVWSVYQEGKLAGAFRVAEDLTLADHHDDLYTLTENAEVGIAHALELPADLAGAFGQIFADYEILQPFRQLGRETYAPTPDELQARVINRFQDKKVATGSVVGLTNRGWERGRAQDGGWIGWFSKRLPGGLEVELLLDPGTYAGDVATEPEQRIPEILIRKPGTWGKEGLVDFARVDPILVSEMIRDADLLAAL